MSHAMLGTRFFERINHRTGPAWHKITEPVDGEFSAETVWRERVGGDEGIVITQESLSVPNFPDLEVPEKLLVRHPTHEDPVYRSFGVVSDEYQIVEPGHIVRLWDEHLGMPVETMGIILEGRCMFLTGDLGRFKVVDETLHGYVCVNSWFDATGAIKMFVSDVREVCQNTVRYAEGLAGDSLYRVVHDRNAMTRISSWMGGMAGRIYGVRETVQEACEVLARAAVTDENGLIVLEAAYPLPRPPQRDAPDDVMEQRWKTYEANKQTATDRRITAAELFEGAGTGMNTKAAFGTLWGLYNSIVELEDYRRGGSDSTAALSAFLGTRAETKQRAFAKALEVARG